MATTTAATVVNAGIIDAHGVNGISLGAGGTVIAQSGTISGNIDAVKFGTTANARLVVDPGAKFNGTLNGGNTIGASHVTTLELASGASAGTLSGLNTNYIDFAQVTIDSGASWTLSGSNSLKSGVTLTSAGNLTSTGTLTNSGSIVVGSPMTTTGKVINSGDIRAASTETAVYVATGGVLTNTSAGTISGGAYGVSLASGVTLTDAGRISGTTDAILFNAGAANRLILDPGAALIGTVDGGNTLGATASSTLELASSASAGTISGLGTQFIDFAQVTLEAGANWAFAGSNTIGAGVTLINSGTLVNDGEILLQSGTFTPDSLSGSGTIAFGTVTGDLLALNTGNAAANVIGNMAAGQTIEILGQTVASAALQAGNTLQLDLSLGGTLDVLLDPAQNFAGDYFHTDNTGGNSFITENTTMPCYLAGTRIRTERGEIAVEALTTADRVILASGGAAPIRWIGQRRLDLSRHRTPKDVQPIVFHPNALADGVPSRALYVSPAHAMAIDGGLIPARLLINGASIVRDTTRRWVHWYHVELDAHGILLAEGTPSESYLDTGNRSDFENGGEPMVLHPTLADGQAGRVSRSCAPFWDTPDRIQPIWQRLANRAVRRGQRLPEPGATTGDPDLVLRIGGRVVRPVHVTDQTFTFVLPAINEPIRLQSRSASPADVRPWLSDDRELGVAVGQIIVRRGEEVETIACDHPALTEGWWPAEQEGLTQWRWTNGDAVLPVRLIGPAVVVIETCGQIEYRATEGLAQAA
jgi:hypothetical protein